jgi:molybdate transport system substrate-binding protein
MREKLRSEPADVLILTASVVADLAREGAVLVDSVADIGVVLTGVAIRSGDALPAIGDAASLRAALVAATAIYFPDPRLATAGIYFSGLLDRLGLSAEVASRLRPHPNGAAAMRALAAARSAQPVGCTQVTEIVSTRGVELVGPLPKEFELATVYTAAVCKGSALEDEARRFIEVLTEPSAHEVRTRAGFLPVSS